MSTPAKEITDFIKGDVVQLKSGGRKMTVLRTSGNHQCMVHVVYMIKGGDIVQKDLVNTVLQLVERNGVPYPVKEAWCMSMMNVAPLTPELVTPEHLADIALEVGMVGGWDGIDPREIIAASVNYYLNKHRKVKP